jgi:hypothetical protein
MEAILQKKSLPEEWPEIFTLVFFLSFSRLFLFFFPPYSMVRVGGLVVAGLAAGAVAIPGGVAAVRVRAPAGAAGGDGAVATMTRSQLHHGPRGGAGDLLVGVATTARAAVARGGDTGGDAAAALADAEAAEAAESSATSSVSEANDGDADDSLERDIAREEREIAKVRRAEEQLAGMGNEPVVEGSANDDDDDDDVGSKKTVGEKKNSDRRTGRDQSYRGREDPTTVKVAVPPSSSSSSGEGSESGGGGGGGGGGDDDDAQVSVEKVAEPVQSRASVSVSASASLAAAATATPTPPLVDPLEAEAAKMLDHPDKAGLDTVADAFRSARASTLAFVENKRRADPDERDDESEGVSTMFRGTRGITQDREMRGATANTDGDGAQRKPKIRGSLFVRPPRNVRTPFAPTSVRDENAFLGPFPGVDLAPTGTDRSVAMRAAARSRGERISRAIAGLGTQGLDLAPTGAREESRQAAGPVQSNGRGSPRDSDADIDNLVPSNAE